VRTGAIATCETTSVLRAPAPARAGAQLQPAVVDRLARAHGNVDAGAGRGVDVAPVHLDARQQPGMRRILVRHVDAAHPRREDGRDRVLVRRQRSRLYAVGEAGIDREKHVLFIDASREFQDDKNQNRLRAQDIDKIVEVLASSGR